VKAAQVKRRFFLKLAKKKTSDLRKKNAEGGLGGQRRPLSCGAVGKADTHTFTIRLHLLNACLQAFNFLKILPTLWVS
jgi:hypothetical protein